MSNQSYWHKIQALLAHSEVIAEGKYGTHKYEIGSHLTLSNSRNTPSVYTVGMDSDKR